MFEKIIEFSCYQEFINNNQDNLPIPAKKNIPEWYKKLEHTLKDKTVKGCMPFLDTLTAGYILKMPVDYHITHNVEYEGERKTGMLSGAKPVNELANQVNLNYNNKPKFHSTKQIEGSPHLEKNKNLDIHKIMNPFKIKTPSGYSCLFVPPLNNSDDRFSIIPGIVDTDTFNLEINFPLVINGDKYEKLETTIKRGTPYVQVIPFKRDSWKMNIKGFDLKKEKENHFFYETKTLINNYKTYFWNKKSWK